VSSGRHAHARFAFVAAGLLILAGTGYWYLEYNASPLMRLLLVAGLYLLASGLFPDWRLSAGTRRPSAVAAGLARAEAWYPDLKTRPGTLLPFALCQKSRTWPPMVEFTLSLTLFAVFGVLAWQVLASRGEDRTLPLIIGILPAAALAWLLSRAILAAFYLALTGDPVVEFSREPLQPGSRVELHIHHPRIRQLVAGEVRLVCRETAWYNDGTSRLNRTQEVRRDRLVKLDPGPAGQGIDVRLAFTIPPDAIHSNRTPNNLIEWFLEVRIEVVGRPDVDLCLPVRVA
jgi:hypothetical protein